MGKHCETFDHTADVGLSARADTLGELFEALAEGLAEVICPPAQVCPQETRSLSCQAEDVEALAVDFLSEVLGVIQGEHFMLASVRVSKMSENSVTAELVGLPYDPARHEIATEVKAVTYHQLAVKQVGPAWTARVILDL